MKNNSSLLKKIYFLSFFAIIAFIACYSQDSVYNNIEVMDYRLSREYEIAEIKVTGVKYLDENVLAQLSGLKVGQKIEIPGEEITKALKKYWKQGLFSDVKISYEKIEGNKVYLNIYLKERPRLASISYKGIKKSDEDDLKEKIELRRGTQITDNLINNTKNIIIRHYLDKGFYNVEVNYTMQEDSVFRNTVNLVFEINKNKRVKIKEINFIGVTAVKKSKLRRAMKETKRKRIYNLSKPSKYIPKNVRDDYKKLIERYNELGYKDARIIKDTLYVLDKKNLILEITIEEGNKYYFRDITWIGNTKLSSSDLNRVLGITKGDHYDQSLLDKRLFMDDDGISTIYLDDGYLFFEVIPVETVVDDSIDIEMRVYEGEQASINEVVINGNTKTNEHVVRRELRSRPGDLFSKTNITRSIMELANLGYFDPEMLDVNPIPDPMQGTVDLKYKVEEKASDQFEVSGGYGGGQFIGSVGLTFNNFSARNMFNGKAWRPIPTGDGQSLGIKVQATGKLYQSYNISFRDPWFGGKKPNSFSIAYYHSIHKRPDYSSTSYYNPYGYSYGYNWKDIPIIGYMKNSGVSLGLGRRLQWPDDYFTLYNELSFQRYNLDNYDPYQTLFDLDNKGTGKYNILNLNTIFGRSSIDQPIYPRRGSNISLGLELTPPYSLFFEVNPSDPDSIKHKWVEYHKWTFKGDWYLKIIENLVLATKTQFGYIAYYNKDKGVAPFGGYSVGIDPMTGAFYSYGKEIVYVRGYQNGELSAREEGKNTANLFTKYTLELRYPVSLKQQATVYVLTFVEAANGWYSFKSFNPYQVKRTVGVGLRAFLPIFGMLGIDYGYRLDDAPGAPAHQGQFHFILGQEF
ncbi:MAG: outer membrane protein assembly factor BamA [Bacteroidales bacterium]|nr:outer membrane protein assembly factor BamA [Bacteroidales bacterium]